MLTIKAPHEYIYASVRYIACNVRVRSGSCGCNRERRALQTHPSGRTPPLKRDICVASWFVRWGSCARAVLHGQQERYGALV